MRAVAVPILPAPGSATAAGSGWVNLTPPTPFPAREGGDVGVQFIAPSTPSPHQGGDGGAALTPVPPPGLGEGSGVGAYEQAQQHLDFAIAEFRAMKMQPALERALRHKGILKA